MAVDIRPRSSWGARYADGDLTLYGLADEVFAHHSVTTQLSPNASVEAECEQMRSIESVGQSRFGTGISYNVAIFPSGRAYQGVSWNRRGTHTGGRNSTSRSIMFVGNYETNEPTPAQLATAAAIYREGKGKWWKSTAPLRGHRDVSQTACPGKNVYAQIPAIRAGRTPTLQEEPDMDATQAKQLSEARAILGDLKEILGGRVDDIGTENGLTHDSALERLLVVTRRTEAQQLAAKVAPVNVDVDANEVAAALLEVLPKATATAVVNAMHTRLAK